ncbi:MAG: DUF3105 domain-containing protein [Actinomycetota bacterium]
MAKKKPRKRRRSEGSGTATQERRQQRLEQRRQEKIERLERQRRAARRAQIIRVTVYALLAAGLFFFFFLRSSPRPESIRGHDLRLLTESEGVQRHVESGVTVDYETNPPAYGRHQPSSLRCGVYGEQQPSEQFVHSLEHGAVGILYDPQQVNPETIERLEAIVGDYPSHVLSMPFSGLEREPIAIVSWGEIMDLAEIDEAAINEYMETFRDKGPESGQSCDNEIDSPFVPEPTPSPSPPGN